jgi:hypothetical protein
MRPEVEEEEAGTQEDRQAGLKQGLVPAWTEVIWLEDGEPPNNQPYGDIQTGLKPEFQNPGYTDPGNRESQNLLNELGKIFGCFGK